MKEIYDYEIETINPVDYKLTLTLPAKDRLLTKLFLRSKVALMRKRGVNVEGDASKIKNFRFSQLALPQQYYNLVKTAITKIYNKLFKEFKEDGIELISNHIKDVQFIRQPSRDWKVKIEINGTYADKR